MHLIELNPSFLDLSSINLASRLTCVADLISSVMHAASTNSDGSDLATDQ
jgi:hypothetical protein